MKALANLAAFVGAVLLYIVLVGGCGAAQLQEVAEDSANVMIAGSGLAHAADECFVDRKELRLEKCAPDDAACKAAAEDEAHEADGFIATIRRVFCKYAPEGTCS